LENFGRHFPPDTDEVGLTFANFYSSFHQVSIESSVADAAALTSHRWAIMVIVTNKPIDPATVFERIRKSESGSILFHYALVKSKAGKRTSVGIHFDKAGDTEEELSAIAADMKKRWNIEDVLLIRRIGTLDIGEIISPVAVSSPSSSGAFDACRNGLDRLKK
jgi:molybdopterin synthase catalytic subunit